MFSPACDSEDAEISVPKSSFITVVLINDERFYGGFQKCYLKKNFSLILKVQFIIFACT
jgi:hypothetical protein